MLATPAQRTVTCEILVHLHDGSSRASHAGQPLRVVDVITFAEDGKIASVRAYKG